MLDFGVFCDSVIPDAAHILRESPGTRVSKNVTFLAPFEQGPRLKDLIFDLRACFRASAAAFRRSRFWVKTPFKIAIVAKLLVDLACDLFAYLIQGSAISIARAQRLPRIPWPVPAGVLPRLNLFRRPTRSSLFTNHSSHKIHGFAVDPSINHFEPFHESLKSA